MKASAAGVAVVGVGLTLQTTQSGFTAQQQQPTTYDPFAAQVVTLTVNGKSYQVSLEPRDMLVSVLRDHIGLIGTKRPCNRMECGGCTVLIDNVPYNSCQYIALRAVGKQILTVEGSSTDSVLNALQTAWVQADGGQCSYCQPGQIMAATALLKQTPNPSLDQIKQGMSGNICRCGNYAGIISGVQLAAQNLSNGGASQ